MKNRIDVIGKIWMPGVTGATTYGLSSYDVENIRNDSGTITREDVERWLDTHSGDFQYVEDFAAYIDGEEFPFVSQDNEFAFSDLMYPAED